MLLCASPLQKLRKGAHQFLRCAPLAVYCDGSAYAPFPLFDRSECLHGVVSVNSFSVDYNKCSDLVVINLARLQIFRIRVARARRFEIRLSTETGVLLRGSENLIAVNIYAVRCSPSQSDDLCLFVEFCREFLASFSILSLAFYPCLF